MVTTDAVLVASHKHKQKRIAPLGSQHLQQAAKVINKAMGILYSSSAVCACIVHAATYMIVQDLV